jgi:hypothetical protein
MKGRDRHVIEQERSQAERYSACERPRLPSAPRSRFWPSLLTDAETVAVLESLGCRRVKARGDGAAFARVPLESIRELRRECGMIELFDKWFAVDVAAIPRT